MPAPQPTDGHTPPDSSEAGDLSPANEVDRTENVKHLELIQAVITRLATNSFFIKGWALTVAAAAFGFAVNRVDSRIAIAGCVVTIGFWILDAYYLRQERLFRHLYNHVRRNIPTELEHRFSMNLSPFIGFSTVGGSKVFFSRTLATFYPLLIAAGALIALLSATTNPVPLLTPMTTATTTIEPTSTATASTQGASSTSGSTPSGVAPTTQTTP